MAGPRKFDVGSWDFYLDDGSRGGKGYGTKDIVELKRLRDQGQGPSPFQFRQLYQRSKELGLPTGDDVQAMLDANNIEGVGAIPRERDIDWNFRGRTRGHGTSEGWGFGKGDLADVTSGSPFSTDHIGRVEQLRDWAWDKEIGVGTEVDDWLKSAKDRLTREETLQTSAQQLEDKNAELMAQVNQEVPIVEPPKPTMPGAGGHFVPGTTRFQGQQSPTRRARGTMKSRFRRTGQGFQSALAISGGNQGATQSKVLNV